MRGGERQLLYLACYLRSQGHDNTVVCRRGSALERESRRLRLELLRLPFLGEWDPISAALLRQAAELSRLPPLLHAHTGHTAALAYLASRVGGPPWVVHRRVDFHLGGKLSRRLKYEPAGKVIAVSDAIRRLLAEDGLPEEKVVTVRDCLPQGALENAVAGVEDPPCVPTREKRREIRLRLGRLWKAPLEAPWIGNVAALVPHKDQANFLKAAALLREKIHDAHFWLVGDGPLRPELEALARSLKIEDAAHFVGHQRSAVPWLQALDLFVLSSWGEGMGSVLLEAMACRLPIVATTAGGSPEVIEDGYNGLLAPPRDPEALARAALRILESGELGERLADHGTLRLSDHTLDNYGLKMERIYDAVYQQRDFHRHERAP